MLNFILKFWRELCCHFCVMSSPVDTVLCRTTILSILLVHLKKFFEDNGVHWWKTPPESPDANPIENLWHELKEFIRRETKPRNKQDLIEGITKFWSTVDKEKCTKYIRHLRKVIPKIIELDGSATGY